jgi:hypothetical protein
MTEVFGALSPSIGRPSAYTLRDPSPGSTFFIFSWLHRLCMHALPGKVALGTTEWRQSLLRLNMIVDTSTNGLLASSDNSSNSVCLSTFTPQHS